MQNILQVISSIDSSTGGPARSVTNLIESMLIHPNVFVDLYCGETSNPVKEEFNSSNGKIYFSKFGRYKELQGLRRNIKGQSPDLLHGHGLWQMPVHQMASIARKLNIPYVISPRGMLDIWSLSHKSYKKKIALKLYQRNDLEKATAIHATSLVEALNIRDAGFQNPIAVIPNGILIPNEILKKYKRGKRTILFLSRLIQNKGIEELVKAWSQMRDSIHQEWELVIVGEGEKEYEKKLKCLMTDLKLPLTSLKGPAYGIDKEKHFLEADLFVLPTYTENFGIAIAEALAFNVPVITTKGAPWEELETNYAGWWIDIGVEPLKIALTSAMNLSDTERHQMGSNGRRLVESNYSIESVAEKMIRLYSWILEGGEKPEFIQIK